MRAVLSGGSRPLPELPWSPGMPILPKGRAPVLGFTFL